MPKYFCYFFPSLFFDPLRPYGGVFFSPGSVYLDQMEFYTKEKIVKREQVREPNELAVRRLFITFITTRTDGSLLRKTLETHLLGTTAFGTYLSSKDGSFCSRGTRLHLGAG
uniref:Uncharacterized protein n=1 Tax=Cacopsylla melanoneura TaxID=428564 RepID=A0A8D8SQQ5_9HEMI